MTRLALEQVTISIHNTMLIQELSWSARAGEIIALTGVNGAGKTTLLRTIAGLFMPQKGLIIIDGQNLDRYSYRERAQRISFLQQHSPEAHYCTGQSRIAHGLMPSLGYDLYLDEHLKEAIKNLGERLAITHLLHKRLNRMSGGEQRLIHLAKCLINPQASIVLLDEPSVFLDSLQQQRLTDNLKAEAHKGRLIIFSSHDERFIERLASSVIHISEQRAAAGLPLFLRSSSQ